MNTDAWVDAVVSTGVYLTLVVAGLWVCLYLLGRGRNARRRKMAKKFEEYCRMYEAGQRDSEDEGFRRHVRDRSNHEDFLRRGNSRTHRPKA